MLIGFLFLFGVVYILFLAFSPSTKTTTVRKIDSVTGQEVIEIHETNEITPAQKAAGVTVGLFGALFGLFIQGVGVVILFILAVVVMAWLK